EASSVTVSPASATVDPNATQAFTATLEDQFGDPMASQPAFAWMVSGGGTIDAAGLFTAGGSGGGPFTVNTTGAHCCTQGTPRLPPPAPSASPCRPEASSVAVSPASATVDPNATQAFTATLEDQFGDPMASQPAFAWMVSGGGTIDGTGLFTAGGSGGGPFTV